MSTTGGPVAEVGDCFVVHMDREALNDLPLELYDVTVSITAFEPNRHIEWTILAEFLDPQIGHLYGYHLEPSDGGTSVTSYYDWSRIDPVWKERAIFPILSEANLRGDTRNSRPHRRSRHVASDPHGQHDSEPRSG